MKYTILGLAQGQPGLGFKPATLLSKSLKHSCAFIKVAIRILRNPTIIHFSLFPWCRWAHQYIPSFFLRMYQIVGLVTPEVAGSTLCYQPMRWPHWGLNSCQMQIQHMESELFSLLVNLLKPDHNWPWNCLSVNCTITFKPVWIDRL